MTRPITAHFPLDDHGTLGRKLATGSFILALTALNLYASNCPRFVVCGNGRSCRWRQCSDYSDRAHLARRRYGCGNHNCGQMREGKSFKKQTARPNSGEC